MKLEQRVGRLEDNLTVPHIWHRIVQRIGETQDQAIDAYGRERVAPGHSIALRVIVRPSKQS